MQLLLVSCRHFLLISTLIVTFQIQSPISLASYYYVKGPIKWVYISGFQLEIYNHIKVRNELKNLKIYINFNTLQDKI